jgi:hypothetical protein
VCWPPKLREIPGIPVIVEKGVPIYNIPIKIAVWSNMGPSGPFYPPYPSTNGEWGAKVYSKGLIVNLSLMRKRGGYSGTG